MDKSGQNLWMDTTVGRLTDYIGGLELDEKEAERGQTVFWYTDGLAVAERYTS